MKRKPNRLDLKNYQSNHIYFLISNCYGSMKYFTDGTSVRNCIEQLQRLIQKFPYRLWAYCFMPDHVHLLIESEDCLNLVKAWKQLTGYEFKKKTGQNLWQKSFYDHVLRKEEDLVETIKYILNNPVRAGLVDNYLDYPYSGSFEIDIRDFSS